MEIKREEQREMYTRIVCCLIKAHPNWTVATIINEAKIIVSKIIQQTS